MGKYGAILLVVVVVALILSANANATVKDTRPKNPRETFDPLHARDNPAGATVVSDTGIDPNLVKAGASILALGGIGTDAALSGGSVLVGSDLIGTGALAAPGAAAVAITLLGIGVVYTSQVNADKMTAWLAAHPNASRLEIAWHWTLVQNGLA